MLSIASIRLVLPSRRSGSLDTVIKRSLAALANLLLGHILNLADGNHLHLFNYVQRSLIKLKILLRSHVAGPRVMRTLTKGVKGSRSQGGVCQRGIDTFCLDNLLKLLDLGLKGEIGSLKILDVLVLRLHCHDLQV